MINNHYYNNYITVKQDDLVIIELVTCKCQKRNVNIKPIPNPINQETKRKAPHLRLAKCLSTVIHSGISRVVCANICVCNRVKLLFFSSLMYAFLILYPLICFFSVQYYVSSSLFKQLANDYKLLKTYMVLEPIIKFHMQHMKQIKYFKCIITFFFINL